MWFPAWLSLGLLVALALAGCAGRAGPASEATGPGDETQGAIEGFVVDDETLPVAGALISIKTVKVSPIALKSHADDEGGFRLENIPAGRQTVTASKEGFNDASTTVTVVAGETAKVRLVLTSKPALSYTKSTLNPIVGHYDCALESVAESGECDLELRNRTGQKVFQTKNNASFQVPPDWGGLLFEVRWSAASDASLIDGIRIFLESQEEPGGFFVRLSGQASPIRIALKAGEKFPGAPLGHPIPQRGVALWIDVLPQGKLEGAGCPVRCGYGAGASLNLEYEIFPTIFYGGPVDPSFSALPAT